MATQLVVAAISPLLALLLLLALFPVGPSVATGGGTRDIVSGPASRSTGRGHVDNPTFEMVQRASAAELASIPYGHVRAAQKARALTSSLHFALDQGPAPVSAERVTSVCEAALVLCREIDRSLGDPIGAQGEPAHVAYECCAADETASAEELLLCLDDFAHRADSLPDGDEVLNLGMVACLVRRGLPL